MNVFLFHRDFRIEDNLALNALSQHGPVTCLFIFTPSQLTENPFYASKGFGFMCASLDELRKKSDKVEEDKKKNEKLKDIDLRQLKKAENDEANLKQDIH